MSCERDMGSISAAEARDASSYSTAANAQLPGGGKS